MIYVSKDSGHYSLLDIMYSGLHTLKDLCHKCCVRSFSVSEKVRNVLRLARRVFLDNIFIDYGPFLCETKLSRYKLTPWNSSWGTHSRLADRKSLWNSKARCHFHKDLILYRVSWIKSASSHPSSSKIHFNIIVIFMTRLFKRTLPINFSGRSVAVSWV
jgi:hypothetical protein